MRSSLMGGASPFAHLSGIVGVGRRRASRAEEDQRDDEARGGRRSRAEDDEDGDGGDDRGSRRSRAEDDNDDRESRQSRAEEDDEQSRRSRAEDDDDDDRQSRRSRAEDDEEEDRESRRSRRSRAEDEDEDEDREGRRSRRSRAEDDEDDDKNEMSGRSAAASARRRERERCAAIFASPHAAANVELAASLAFETTMTRKEAIAVLKSQAGRGGGSTAHDVRSDRRDRNPNLLPGGGGGGQVTGQQLASAWDSALAKAGVPVGK